MVSLHLISGKPWSRKLCVFCFWDFSSLFYGQGTKGCKIQLDKSKIMQMRELKQLCADSLDPRKQRASRSVGGARWKDSEMRLPWQPCVDWTKAEESWFIPVSAFSFALFLTDSWGFAVLGVWVLSNQVTERQHIAWGSCPLARKAQVLPVPR